VAATPTPVKFIRQSARYSLPPHAGEALPRPAEAGCWPAGAAPSPVRVTHSGVTAEGARNRRGRPELPGWLKTVVSGGSA